VIVKVHTAQWLLVVLTTVTGWFGRGISIDLLDENKEHIQDLNDDSDVYYVRILGLDQDEEG
jgi:hypothetical protein